jgi:deazaflavin-dependent oxidoreductase (nitroreductase family)
MDAWNRFVSNNPWLVPYITRVHRFLYKASDGRIGAGGGRTTFILLSSVGRKSGQARQSPLLTLEDGDRWVVVASNGGTEQIPGWWFNLQARPETTLQAGRIRHRVRARQATPEETEKLWPRLTDVYEYFDAYQDRTQRTIPVVLLEPLTNGDGP